MNSRRRRRGAPRYRAAGALLRLSLAVLGGCPARAQPGDEMPHELGVLPELRLEGRGCAESLLSDVAGQLRIELAGRASQSSALLVRVTCKASEVEILVLSEEPHALEVGQRVALSSTSKNLKARILALTIAELIRESEPAEHAEAPSRSRQSSAPRPPARALPPDTPAAKKAIRVIAFAQSSSFGFDTPLAWGGGLRLDYAVAGFAFGLDSTLARGQESRPLGTATTTLQTLSLYAAWAPQSGDFSGRLGIGHGLGIGRVSGEARGAGATDAEVTGAWAAPYALAGLGVELAAAVIEVRLELGWVTVPVEGLVSDAEPIRMSGVWSSMQLGAGLHF